MKSKALNEVMVFLSDLEFYSGPCPATAESLLVQLKKLAEESVYMENVLERCQERAKVFARSSSQDRPRKSAVAACTWIDMEITGLFNKQESQVIQGANET